MNQALVIAIVGGAFAIVVALIRVMGAIIVELLEHHLEQRRAEAKKGKSA
jgi:hypothetical protein